MYRHKFDPSSLVAGALFAGLAARYLAGALGGRAASFGWIVPGVLVGLGVVGVLRILTRSRRRPR